MYLKIGVTQAEWDTYFYRYTETSKRLKNSKIALLKTLLQNANDNLKTQDQNQSLPISLAATTASRPDTSKQQQSLLCYTLQTIHHQKTFPEIDVSFVINRDSGKEIIFKWPMQIFQYQL